MAVKVKSLISVSGKVEVSYVNTSTLSAAETLLPDELAAQIKTKILTIGGVDSADVHCGILDIMEVTT